MADGTRHLFILVCCERYQRLFYPRLCQLSSWRVDVFGYERWWKGGGCTYDEANCEEWPSRDAGRGPIPTYDFSISAVPPVVPSRLDLQSRERTIVTLRRHTFVAFQLAGEFWTELAWCCFAGRDEGPTMGAECDTESHGD